MIDWPGGSDARQPYVLIMDTTPLSLLATIEGLDWLFAPGCPVMITDMVLAEATRDPGEGRDLWRRARAFMAQWLERNRYRLTILSTVDGERYAREMLLWEKAGKPAELRPDWSDRGERSVLSAIQDLKRALAHNEEIIVIMDDRDGRDAVRAIRADITLMGTRSFIRWMEEDFDIAAASTAWQTIRLATAGTAADGEEDDPVHIRPA